MHKTDRMHQNMEVAGDRVVGTTLPALHHEGYLFLAQLGELSGDPLVRSVVALPETHTYL